MCGDDLWGEGKSQMTLSLRDGVDGFGHIQLYFISHCYNISSAHAWTEVHPCCPHETPVGDQNWKALPNDGPG